MNNNHETFKDICTVTGATLCTLDDLKESAIEQNLLFEDMFGREINLTKAHATKPKFRNSTQF